jgi:hypothetical protein
MPSGQKPPGRVLEGLFQVSVQDGFRGEEGSESQRSLLVGYEEEVISGVDGGKQYTGCSPVSVLPGGF